MIWCAYWDYKTEHGPWRLVLLLCLFLSVPTESLLDFSTAAYVPNDVTYLSPLTHCVAEAPRVSDPPASISRVLGLQKSACVVHIMLESNLQLPAYRISTPPTDPHVSGAISVCLLLGYELRNTHIPGKQVLYQ